MRLLVSGFCISVGLLAAATASAQPAGSSTANYGDRQAGHFGDPGAGYFGNPGDGSFGSQSLDAARARAAGTQRPGSTRRSPGPSPYVVLDPTLKPKPPKTVPGTATPTAPASAPAN